MAGERWAHLHENWLILLLSCVYFSSLLWFPAKRRALTVQQISSSWPKQDQMYSKVRSSAGCSFLSACLVCWPVYFFHWLRKHGTKTWSWVPGEWGSEGKDLFKFCTGHIRIILPGGSSSHTNCWVFLLWITTFTLIFTCLPAEWNFRVIFAWRLLTQIRKAL